MAETYMLLETLLGGLALVQHQLRHPVASHDAIVSALVVLSLDELGHDGFELFAVRLQRTISDVHFVRGKADEWVQHQRRSQVVVLRQLLRCHGGRCESTMRKRGLVVCAAFDRQ